MQKDNTVNFFENSAIFAVYSNFKNYFDLKVPENGDRFYVNSRFNFARIILEIDKTLPSSL